MNAFEIAKELKQNHKTKINNSKLAVLMQQFNRPFKLESTNFASICFSSYFMTVCIIDDGYRIQIFQYYKVKNYSYKHLISDIVISDPFHQNLGQHLFELGII